VPKWLGVDGEAHLERADVARKRQLLVVAR
jgi:hypothetical protein